MRTLTVGRSPQCDIVLSSKAGRVSRMHARITERRNGRYLVEDLKSAAGVFTIIDGRWERVGRIEVAGSTPIKFADFETTITSLIALSDRQVGDRLAAQPPIPGQRAGVASPAMADTRPAEVFLSYAHADIDRVRPLVGLLEQQGWGVFWDAQIGTGQQWPERIDAALKAAKAV